MARKRLLYLRLRRRNNTHPLPVGHQSGAGDDDGFADFDPFGNGGNYCENLPQFDVVAQAGDPAACGPSTTNRA